MVFSDLFNFKDLTSVSTRNFKPCGERWHFMRAIKLKRRKKLKEELKREWVKRYLILNKSSGPKRYVNFSLSLASFISPIQMFFFFSLSLIFVQSVMNLKLIVFALFVMVRRLDFIFLRPRFD